MKKVFKSAMLVLAMLTTGLVTTSCDSETLQQIIGMLFNTGQTYSMEITADVKKVMLISFDGAAYFNSIKVYVQPTK